MSEQAAKVGQRNAAGDKKRILDIRQKAADIEALTMELHPNEVITPEDVLAIPTLEEQPTKNDSAETETTSAVKGDGLPNAEPVHLPIALTNVVAIKTDTGEWLLDVLGVPFGGPNGGRDSDGEYFSNKTKLHLDKFPTPPIAYYHGFDENGSPQGEPQYIGKTISTQAKNDGVWFRVVLDKANTYAQRIWEAAKQGLARASSGSIAHMVRKDRNGHITHWPVVELSLIDAVGKRQPANQYAVALPVMKAVYKAQGLILPDIESPNQDQPEAIAQSAAGMSQVADAATSQEATTNNKQSDNRIGVLKMDPTEVQTLIATAVADALKNERDAADAKKKEEDVIQARIDAALAAQKATFDAQAQATNVAGASDRRLPNGQYDGAAPVRQFANLDKYEGMDPIDISVMIGMLKAAQRVGQSNHGPSEDAYRALAIRVQDSKDDSYGAAKSAIKMAGISAKANEVNSSTLSGGGADWVGVTYSTQLWEKIRLATEVAARIPAIVVPQGSNSIVIPVQSTSPTFYVVAQAASQSANPGRVNPTYTTSKEVTTSQTLTVKKLGAAVPYSGEMEEDSLIPWVSMLRMDMTKEGAEVLESVIIDGDTTLSATTNINHIAGTPGGTEYYTLFDGFRKLALVTNTANARNKAGALAAADYLATAQMLGLAGRNALLRQGVSFITDLPTNYASANLTEFKTRDVYLNPTIEGGLLKNVYGFDVIPTPNMHRINQDTTYAYKANTAGKIDQGTASNNTTGSILAVRWDQWKLGYKRDMTFEIQRDAISDSTFLVMGMRVGLLYRDTEAASITYGITGV